MEIFSHFFRIIGVISQIFHKNIHYYVINRQLFSKKLHDFTFGKNSSTHLQLNDRNQWKKIAVAILNSVAMTATIEMNAFHAIRCAVNGE